MFRTTKILVSALALAALAACASSPKKTEPVPAPVAVKPAPAPVPAPVKAEPSRLEVVCEQGTDRRTVIVLPKETGCEVHYSKFGHSERVATAVHEAAFCDRVQDNIRDNLEEGRFSCK
jgi:hypothetical protein